MVSLFWSLLLPTGDALALQFWGPATLPLVEDARLPPYRFSSSVVARSIAAWSGERVTVLGGAFLTSPPEEYPLHNLGLCRPLNRPSPTSSPLESPPRVGFSPSRNLFSLPSEPALIPN